MLVSFARLSDETLLLFNRVHWFAKKSIKMFRIFFEVCYKFNFMKQRRNVFKTNQHVFELVARLAYLLDSLRVVHLLRILNRQISLVLQNFKLFKKKLISIKRQYDLWAEFFSLIVFLISSFIQGGSLSSQIILSCGVKLWVILRSALAK